MKRIEISFGTALTSLALGAIENRPMIDKIKLIIIFWIMIISGCSSSIHFGNEIEKALNSIISPQVAITKILVESSEYILENNHIEPNEEIFINSLNIEFNSLDYKKVIQIDSVLVKMINDTINFKQLLVKGDSLIFKNVEIPNIQYQLPDSLLLNVRCDYKFDINDEAASCLKSKYTIIKFVVNRKENYKDCDN